MKSYLDEKMWRQWRAENPQNAMDNFLAVLAGQYIVNNPVLQKIQTFQITKKCFSVIDLF